MKKEGEKEAEKQKKLAMLAPSFVGEFSYPEIILGLRELGFDKVVELTFGAKLVNRKYHQILKKSKKLLISSVCPGIVQTILEKYPKLKKNIMPVVSPMIATAKICRKIYPKHKIIFISPCNFKKIESSRNENKKYIDEVLDYQELKKLFKQKNINLNKIKKSEKINSKNNANIHFDKFYNDYTKIYPLAGGLSKTAHLKGIVGANDTEIIDGINNVEKFLKNPDKSIKFLDANFCVGGCVGGPCFSQNTLLEDRKKRVLDYIEKAKHEKISQSDLGILERAKNINLNKKY
jgi:iron only hydrogenase large subunit-like protein